MLCFIQSQIIGLDGFLGGKPVYQKDSLQIKMDSDNIYEKKLRKTLPYRSAEWSSDSKENVAAQSSCKSATVKHRRGVERWQALPQKVEVWNGLLITPITSYS